MSLFRLGDYTLASGRRSAWKIDCDGLDDDDWAALARMVAEMLKDTPFSAVEGVPRGGLPFARALERYRSTSGGLLIAEDVVTTGGSMERHRGGREAQGVVVFSRGGAPAWVRPLFVLDARVGT